MTSKTTYLGNNEMDSVHEDSGNTMHIGIPQDNFNKRDNFSPTDLFATSLAQSIFAAISVLGKDRNIDITGATCELKKTMYFQPRRIGEIFCVLKFPQKHSEDEKKFIEDTAHNCPVYLSLHPDIKKILIFEYAD
ncbi:OsmC family protein [Chryseobacterium sp. POL2]|uniref:OsmC family protein n=1 Tax=Chryseobacterium sp. POL2 TaxID=2713414 RepID=UPI0013E1285D|nr:OsmC family protein [Chryseobacterium sp. POL2]QIG89916.1 OsmC family protein [Chryseobacterium sp. POL2]